MAELVLPAIGDYIHDELRNAGVVVARFHYEGFIADGKYRHFFAIPEKRLDEYYKAIEELFYRDTAQVSYDLDTILNKKVLSLDGGKARWNKHALFNLSEDSYKRIGETNLDIPEEHKEALSDDGIYGLRKSVKLNEGIYWVDGGFLNKEKSITVVMSAFNPYANPTKTLFMDIRELLLNYSVGRKARPNQINLGCGNA